MSNHHYGIMHYSETIVVALWNQHAEQFNGQHYIENSSRGPVILLFVGLTVRIFNGMRPIIELPLDLWTCIVTIT